MTPEQQGGAVLTVAAAGVGIAVFVYSRDAFVLLAWAIGAAAVWWAAKTPNKIDNPSPEGGPERGSGETPQASGVEVTRVGEGCTIVSHPSERRSYGVDKRDTTES